MINCCNGLRLNQNSFKNSASFCSPDLSFAHPLESTETMRLAKFEDLRLSFECRRDKVSAATMMNSKNSMTKPAADGAAGVPGASGAPVAIQLRRGSVLDCINSGGTIDANNQSRALPITTTLVVSKTVEQELLNWSTD